jgi:excisionase family DNA binding protein
MSDSNGNGGRIEPLRLVVSINISLAEDVQAALLGAIGSAAHPPSRSREHAEVPMSRAEDQWLDLSHAAEFVGVSTSTLYKYTSHGKIEFGKLAGRLQFRRSVLEGFMEKQVHPARNGPQLRSIISAALGSGK